MTNTLTPTRIQSILELKVTDGAINILDNNTIWHCSKKQDAFINFNNGIYKINKTLYTYNYINNKQVINKQDVVEIALSLDMLIENLNGTIYN